MSNGVTVEFFGVPGRRAGCRQREFQAESIRELLEELQTAYPEWTDLMGENGQLSEHYVISLNEREFVIEPERKLNSGDHVILLSKDVGG